MYKFFGYVNEVYSHNKSRHYDLALDKFWVNQCGWLRLCTTFVIGMNITNGWKPFSYGVNRYHYEKLIDIRELSERLALDFFNNTFQMMLGPRKRTYITLISSIKERQFLISVHLVFPVLILLPQRSALFPT